MADEENTEEEAPKKKGKKGLVIGLVLALALGGGAFYATFSGLVMGSETAEVKEDKPYVEETELATFVEIDPLSISLGAQSNLQLRFRAQLEVETSKSEAVQNAMPRILDVLNGYLRAVDVRELQDPTALIRLRVQMLRRVQLVTGTGHVRDFLITEFVFT